MLLNFIKNPVLVVIHRITDSYEFFIDHNNFILKEQIFKHNLVDCQRHNINLYNQ